MVSFRGFVSFLGFCVLVKVIRYVYKVLVAYFGKPVNIKAKFNTDWVMITGASSGVGKELSLMCADQGLNIIGIGRSESKLHDVALKVMAKKVQFIEIVQDLSDVDAVERIQNRIKEYQIGALFVCHGAGTMDKTENLSHEFITGSLRAGITSNSLLLKNFVANSHGKGTVTFISSLSSVVSAPYVQLYGAEKKFLDHMGRTIQSELPAHNISLQVISPGVINDTDFFRLVRDTPTKQFMGLKPATVARMILATAGKNFSVDVGVDCIATKFLYTIIPPPVFDWVLVQSMKSQMADIQKAKKSE